MRTLADRLSGAAAAAPLLVAAMLVTAPGVAAQEARNVVSKSVSVGGDGATLELEFEAGPPLAVSLTHDQVIIDDTVVGTFDSGDALDDAWRTLLGFVVALDGPPLARMLIDWTPPDDLSGAELDPAQAIDTALEAAFGAPDAEDEPSRDAPSADVGTGIALRALVSLLDRSDGLTGLAEALDGIDLDDVRLSVGDDLVIPSGDDVQATVLVVDADVDIAGRVRGDVVVVDGDIRLAPSGRIDGDVRYSDGTIVDEGGRIDGDVIRIEAETRDVERRTRDEVRSEIRSEMRDAMRDASRSRRGESFFGRVFGGIGGALGDLFSVVVLAIIGGVVVHYAGGNLDAIAETARRTPGRALMVGTAGAFLTLPAFVLGIVALAISIVGIPALILWIPLFPIAVALAAGLGFLGVCRNVGIWVERQRFPYLGWVRLTNPVTLIAGGALALALPAIAAQLVSVVPWTGALEMLLRVTGVLMSMLAVLLGFGAVLLTRAGRRPEFFDDDLFGGWGPPLDPPTGPDAPDRAGEGDPSGAASNRGAGDTNDDADPGDDAGAFDDSDDAGT